MTLPRLIGHRGLAGIAPENTPASFKAAAARGITMVEFDVRLSKDGVPVVFHYDVLDRTSNGSGPVAARNWRYLSRLDTGSWFGKSFAGEPLASLEQSLGLCLDLGLEINMEIKPDAGREAETTRAALAVAASLWPLERPVPLVSSFAIAALEVAASMLPQWRRGLLADDLPETWRELATRLDVATIHLRHDTLDAAKVMAIKEAGYGVLAYTVNDPVRAARLWGWGVDAIFSDFPHSS
ncbi:MAG: glycerophosphodiester phosphodiesterase [Magnetospirillum sp.]|nr:glycerophosphodiester phosphodiesterase [Magnetospirillum sp.]